MVWSCSTPSTPPSRRTALPGNPKAKSHNQTTVKGCANRWVCAALFCPHGDVDSCIEYLIAFSNRLMYIDFIRECEVGFMPRISTRTANIYTRVDPETKEQAEAILLQLGIPMSNAIGMFLKQVVMHRGIPFEMKLPTTVPLSAGCMTAEQLSAELQKGMDDVAAGRVVSADVVEDEMRRMYGI